jgi:drug/metabolite transporter (DMT)-like permease
MQKSPLFFVLLSAILYGLSIPLAKILLSEVSPVSLAGLLYLGAFVGLTLFGFFDAKNKEKNLFDRNDLIWLAGVIFFGGILAPIFLMLGLSQVFASVASLLLNLEGVATALVASLVFREFTGKRFWFALFCMTMAGVVLSWDNNAGTFSLSGPVYIIAAMFFWGLDNNFTSKIKNMKPIEIAKTKCLVAGIVNLGLGFWLGSSLITAQLIVSAMLVGTLSYGASLILYIYALKGWGAARTGAFFSVAPFVGAILSVLILGDQLSTNLLFAFMLMAIGAWLIASERHVHLHYHGAVSHVHEHYHNEIHQHEH